MADVEEFETDSTIDQQIDIAVGEEESDYDAEEIVGATDRNGLTGTPQVPVPSSSASREDEPGEEAGGERGSVSPSSARVHGHRAVVASEQPAVAGSTGSPDGLAVARGRYRQWPVLLNLSRHLAEEGSEVE